MRSDTGMGEQYGYARVSTDEQSVGLQVDALTRVGVAGERIYQDEGVSGSTPAMERPGFSALLGVLQPGDTLHCYSISRVGRSTLDVLALLEVLEGRGITFRSCTEPISTDKVGKLVLTILAAVAEMERAQLIERTRDGLAAARARGSKIGRPPVPERTKTALRTLVASGIPTEAAGRELGLGRASAFRIMREARNV
ncbi:MAG: hypothetical protein JWN04_1203 [Myxococcaceae bacterium]|nr:hypothetical protein [Myxococcaceae bacterium]